MEMLKWFGTTIIILGALLTSFKFDPFNVYVLNLGTIVWLIVAVKMKENSLIVVNAIMLLIYVFGTLIRIIH